MELNASSYTIAQMLFLKGLALTYFLAFWSLFVQMKGLYGSKGIIPISELIQGIEKAQGKKLYFSFPTIFWFRSDDTTLMLTAGLGMVFSLMVLFGVVPWLFLFLLWLIYLSFLRVGSVFLSFQWDILLVEVGFIGIFFSMQTPPSTILLFVLWFFLFRFMFASGIVKLLSRCPEWRSLKAMDVHYETQPIPNRLAYYAHQQSEKMARFSVLGVFFFELIVPFLIFFQQTHLIAFILLVFFQILIILTGNYAFFNLLTIVLCFPLLTDSQLGYIFNAPVIDHPPSIILSIFLTIVGGILLFLNIIEFAAVFFSNKTFYQILRFVAPYSIVNSYGLFARMTTKRNEIIIEGSDDGINWKAYEFNWKPGDLSVAPKQVAPHQPRLDWQMWFAALSHYQNNQWFIRFLGKLLEGSKDVSNLLKTNPFPEHPPKFIRSQFYQYHFTDLKTKKETGQWWTRTHLGLYSPVCSLQKNEEKPSPPTSGSSFTSLKK